MNIGKIKEDIELRPKQTALKQGLPETDSELTKAFVLKSNSEQTRRTYRTTLEEFLDYAELRSGRRIQYAEVTFQDVTKWRDLLIGKGRRAHTIATKLAILASLFEYGRVLGVCRV